MRGTGKQKPIASEFIRWSDGRAHPGRSSINKKVKREDTNIEKRRGGGDIASYFANAQMYRNYGLEDETEKWSYRGRSCILKRRTRTCRMPQTCQAARVFQHRPYILGKSRKGAVKSETELTF